MGRVVDGYRRDGQASRKRKAQVIKEEKPGAQGFPI